MQINDKFVAFSVSNFSFANRFDRYLSYKELDARASSLHAMYQSIV